MLKTNQETDMDKRLFVNPYWSFFTALWKKQVCICLLAYFGSWTRTSRLLSSVPGLANNVFAQRSLNSAFVILCRGNCSICLFSSTALTASTLVAVTLVARNYGEGNNTLAALTLVTVTVPTTVFLSPSGDLGIRLVWHNRTPPPHRFFGPTVEILFKLN